MIKDNLIILTPVYLAFFRSCRAHCQRLRGPCTPRSLVIWTTLYLLAQHGKIIYGRISMQRSTPGESRPSPHCQFPTLTWPPFDFSSRLDAKLAQLHGFWQEKYGDEAMLTPGSVAGDPFSQLLDIFRQCESVQSDDPS